MFTSLLLLLSLQWTGQCEIRPSSGGADAEEVSTLGETLRNPRRVPPEFLQAAQRRLAVQSPEALPVILLAMKGRDLVATNWLRASGEAILEHGLADGKQVPLTALEKIAENAHLDCRLRRIAIAWIDRSNSKAATQLLLSHLDDPVLGPQAIERLLRQSESRLDGNVPSKELLHRALHLTTISEQERRLSSVLHTSQKNADPLSHPDLVTSAHPEGSANPERSPEETQQQVASLSMAWSSHTHVRWQVSLSQAGTSGPVILRDQVLLTTTSGRRDAEISVESRSIATGELLWTRRMTGAVAIGPDLAEQSPASLTRVLERVT